MNAHTLVQILLEESLESVYNDLNSKIDVEMKKLKELQDASWQVERNKYNETAEDEAEDGDLILDYSIRNKYYVERDGRDENEAFGSVTKNKGSNKFQAYYEKHSGGVVLKENFDTFEEAVNAVKEAIKYNAEEKSEELDRIVYSAFDKLASAFTFPENVLSKGWFSTSGGSKYLEFDVARGGNKIDWDDDGEVDHYKLSIRDHEPSPFRADEFGKVDEYWIVSNPPTLKEYYDALTAAQKYVYKVSGNA